MTPQEQDSSPVDFLNNLNLDLNTIRVFINIADDLAFEHDEGPGGFVEKFEIIIRAMKDHLDNADHRVEMLFEAVKRFEAAQQTRTLANKTKRRSKKAVR